MCYSDEVVLHSCKTSDVSQIETMYDSEVVSAFTGRRHRTGALRTARWRARRLRGYRVYQIEVSDADIKALMARGLLDRQNRHDPNSAERAIGALLDRL
jgi:hypothetical protein